MELGVWPGGAARTQETNPLVMCGINGIYAYHHAASRPSRDELVRTRDAMANRGPDGSGFWESEDRRCLLGHRRLSIIDLSAAGSQPIGRDSIK